MQLLVASRGRMRVVSSVLRKGLRVFTKNVGERRNRLQKLEGSLSCATSSLASPNLQSCFDHSLPTPEGHNHPNSAPTTVTTCTINTSRRHRPRTLVRRARYWHQYDRGSECTPWGTTLSSVLDVASIAIPTMAMGPKVRVDQRGGHIDVERKSEMEMIGPCAQH